MARRKQPRTIKPLGKKARAGIKLSATQRAIVELLAMIGRPLTDEGLAYRLRYHEHPITEARMRTVRKQLVDQDLLAANGHSGRSTLWALTDIGRSLVITLREEAQPGE